jgi:hypothetical protein
MARVADADFRDIAEVKARYCRCLDEKDWAGYADTFTADVVLDTTASGGQAWHGREAAVGFVSGSLGGAITVHQVHSPEMDALDGDTVDVIWAMQDRVIWDEARAQRIGTRGLTGFGHYRERYRRCDDGRWRIAESRLTRLHIDFEPL